ncbi:MAG: hypothetical protein J0I43_16000 [Microbacterium sp.]|uniref:YciI family protein n=1 Tax=Microbacterium sp. TaxID=51671 RepID=UPI001AC8CD22|nr:YciI family protein [Microbacterium sp.]MBN9178853.1 hypothetical protein [Microbacterium sp.]
MPTFAVTYAYRANSENDRATHRPAHLAFLEGLHHAGLLYMSGPLAGDEPRALLVFEDTDESTLAARLDDDPFAEAGLIEARTIATWNVFFDPRTAA